MSADARADVRDTRDYYEAQRSGLGRRFLQALVESLDQVIERPRSFPVVHPGVRRAMLRKFPYGVFFREPTDAVHVIAIVHLHRHPNAWRRRA